MSTATEEDVELRDLVSSVLGSYIRCYFPSHNFPEAISTTAISPTTTSPITNFPSHFLNNNFAIE